MTLVWAKLKCDIMKHLYLPFFFKRTVKLDRNMIKSVEMKITVEVLQRWTDIKILLDIIIIYV